MTRVLRRLRPSPALVVASIALTVSLGGVGYAATRLPRNSVGALQLRNNAVSSAKVKNHSLKSADFARGVVRQGARGAAGPQGPAGGTGPAGPQGPPGVGIGGSCSGGSAIRAVAGNGTVVCQPAATDSVDGYLSAADHAAFSSPATYARAVALNANTTMTNPGFYINNLTFTIPASQHIHQLAMTWYAEWTGGTSAAPQTLNCYLKLDGTQVASSHNTNDGGYQEITLSGVASADSGQHVVESGCGRDTGTAVTHAANLVMIGTE